MSGFEDKDAKRGPRGKAPDAPTSATNQYPNDGVLRLLGDLSFHKTSLPEGVGSLSGQVSSAGLMKALASKLSKLNSDYKDQPEVSADQIKEDLSRLLKDKQVNSPLLINDQVRGLNMLLISKKDVQNSFQVNAFAGTGHGESGIAASITFQVVDGQVRDPELTLGGKKVPEENGLYSKTILKIIHQKAEEVREKEKL